MNKKEQAKMDALAESLGCANYDTQMAKSLGWSFYPKPAVTNVPSSGITTGWLMNSYRLVNGYGGIGNAVEEAWSKPTSHGFGKYVENRTGSQNGSRLYVTRKDALIALRRAVEIEFAKKLCAVDVEIEKEDNGTESC